jgi:hypothetical protein
MADPQGVPDVYADFVEIATTQFGIFMGFLAVKPLDLNLSDVSSTQNQPEMPTELKAIVRFSPAQAKVFAIILRQSLQDYEEGSGVIPLPSGFAERYNIEDNEW